MAGTVRVLVVEDEAMVRRLLCRFIRGQEGLTVVGSVGDGQEALDAVETHSPDVVLMDVTLPRLSGDRATQEIVRRFPGVKVLAVSGWGDLGVVSRMMDAGASGYFSKDGDLEELVSAIHSVAQGKSYLCAEIAAKLLASAQPSVGLPAVLEELSATAPGELTSRERAVVQLIAEGFPSREIAIHLGLTEKTVTSYRERIMEKLDLHSIAALTKYAVRHGLTPPK
ncbi:MAG: response regulator transcription factor [Polyangia bacterium]|nr:response regulator transcription factor [Polyangia bacterium]